MLMVDKLDNKTQEQLEEIDQHLRSILSALHGSIWVALFRSKHRDDSRAIVIHCVVVVSQWVRKEIRFAMNDAIDEVSIGLIPEKEENRRCRRESTTTAGSRRSAPRRDTSSSLSVSSSPPETSTPLHRQLHSIRRVVALQLLFSPAHPSPSFLFFDCSVNNNNYYYNNNIRREI